MSFTNLTFGLLANMLERGMFDLDDHATLHREDGFYILRTYLGIDGDNHAELMTTLRSTSLHEVILFYAMESAQFKEVEGY